jgi:hypothetical protein
VPARDSSGGAGRTLTEMACPSLDLASSMPGCLVRLHGGGRHMWRLLTGSSYPTSRSGDGSREVRLDAT